MFNHTVIFWTNPDLEGAADEMLEALSALRNIPGVVHISSGKKFIPSKPPKGTVDMSYQIALHVQFEDEAGHDYYQTHELHQPVLELVRKYCFWDDALHVKAYDWSS